MNCRNKVSPSTRNAPVLLRKVVQDVNWNKVEQKRAILKAAARAAMRTGDAARICQADLIMAAEEEHRSDNHIGFAAE